MVAVSTSDHAILRLLRVGFGTTCHSRFRRGLPGLHTMHYLTCIMHQQALNIKLWMHAKIPRVVYSRERALCCANNLPTFCKAEQSESRMILHNWAPYAINVNKFRSFSLACLHVLTLPLSIKTVGCSSQSIC